MGNTKRREYGMKALKSAVKATSFKLIVQLLGNLVFIVISAVNPKLPLYSIWVPQLSFNFAAAKWIIKE